MVLHSEEIHPEKRQLVEHLAFVRHPAGQNYIESADAVGDDHQQFVAQIENIAHLPAFPRQFRNDAIEQRMVLVVFHRSSFHFED